MAFLVDWLHALISLVLLLALAELILPDGSLRPYVRVILGVVLVVAVLRPVLQLGAFQWSLPALTVPPPAQEAPLVQGERLAAALQDRARGEVERQAALQAARLLEVRVGVRPEAVTVRLTPEGWVERIGVVLDDGASGPREVGPPGPAPETGGVDGITLEMTPVRPVIVTTLRTGETRPALGEAGAEPVPAPPSGEGDSERSRQVRAVLAEFYQIPLDRVQVRP